MREYKVVLTSQLASYLHLFLLPSRTHMPSSNGGVLAARYKKNCRHFELEVPVDTKHKTYSRERGADLAASSQSGSIKLAGVGGHSLGGSGSTPMIDKVTLAGGPVDDLNAKYFVGILRNGMISL